MPHTQQLRQLEEDLRLNLAAVTRLHQLGLLSTQRGTLHEVLTEIVNAAIDITGSDFGTIQLLDSARGDLRMEVAPGFPDWCAGLIERIPAGAATTCGTALLRGERVIVENIETSPIFSGGEELSMLLEVGVRAAQSTPLVSRSGQKLGMFSTHYKKPHHPDKRTLEWLDLLARQAADLIEQRQSETALNERSLELARLAGELTLAEHRERRRIADHVHDNLQQLLLAARLQSDAISRFVPENAGEPFEALGRTLKEAIEITHDLTRELAPPIHINGNLPETCHWLASEVRRQHLLEVEVDVRGNFDDVPEAEGILLYSAARELLLNVVKHSGVLAARLELAREGQTVVVRIIDKGRGYDPMAVASNKAQGLGLFSIKERLALMGGTLSVESALSQGTLAELNIPMTAVAQVVNDGQGNVNPEDDGEVDLTTEKPTASSPRIRVVFVDDHRIVRESLVSLLNGEPDIRVVGQCENGRDAVEHAERLESDVFVMDRKMPVMDGIEATRIIKDRWPSIKVIGLSMTEEGEAAARMRAAGADDYVSKSGPTEELVAAIRRCCVAKAPFKKGGGAGKRRA